MSTPILATKLYIPPPRPKVVLRPRLAERLNEGLHRKLTLISAPAGFGKTTRLSEWSAGLQLAAISMQAHKHATGFIKSFTGIHHFVMDYLLEEVLLQQSESVQT